MRPAWSGDGRTLFFRSRDRVCAVDVAPGPVISRARVVLSALPDTRFDAAADGTRFIMERTPGGTGSTTADQCC